MMKSKYRRRMFKIRKRNGEWAVFKLTHSASQLYVDDYIWLDNCPSMEQAMEYIYKVWLQYEPNIPNYRPAV